MKKVLPILIFILMMQLSPSLAQNKNNSWIDDPAMERAINNRLVQEKQKLEQSVQRETGFFKELFIIENELRIKERELGKLNNRYGEVVQNLEKTRLEADRLTREAEARLENLANRLRAIYKAGRGMILRQLFEADSIRTFLERYNALVRILKNDVRLLTNYRADAALLKAKRLEMLRQKDELAKLVQSARANAFDVEIERRKRLMIMDRIQRDKSLAMKTTRELEAAKLQAQSQIENITSKPSGSLRKPERPLVLDFESRKGYLPMPVDGPIIGFFGRQVHPTLGTTTFSSGIDIKAGAGYELRAVADGKVCYVGDILGYGRVVIIDHGNRYHTLYGHLDQIFIMQDDLVTRGTPLATVGSTGSLTGSKLHFEIRHMGQAIDPLLWLEKGKQ